MKVSSTYQSQVESNKNKYIVSVLIVMYVRLTTKIHNFFYVLIFYKQLRRFHTTTVKALRCTLHVCTQCALKRFGRRRSVKTPLDIDVSYNTIIICITSFSLLSANTSLSKCGQYFSQSDKSIYNENYK